MVPARSRTLPGMSGEREELARLAHEIPDDQVPAALAEMRRHLRPVTKRSWPPAWFGIAAGDGTAVGARSEELLAEGFGQQVCSSATPVRSSRRHSPPTPIIGPASICSPACISLTVGW